MSCGEGVVEVHEHECKNKIEKYSVSQLNDETILLFQTLLNDFCDIMKDALSNRKTI